MRQDARGWFTGMSQRDGMGRDVEGGFRMGNTGIPVADSFRYLAKLIQYYNVLKIKKKKEFSTACCDPHNQRLLCNQ